MKAFVPLAMLAAQAVAAPLETPHVLDGEVILPVSRISVSDTSPDGVAPLLVETRTFGIAAFDPTQGVLRALVQVPAPCIPGGCRAIR